MSPFGQSKPSAELLDFYRPNRYFHRRNGLPHIQGYGQLLLVNSLVMSLVALLISIQYVSPYLGLHLYDCAPWDTFVLIALWLWCGFRVFADKEDAPSMAEEQQHKEAEGRPGPREGLHMPSVAEQTSAQSELRPAPL
jgi:hypothetical protein